MLRHSVRKIAQKKMERPRAIEQESRLMFSSLQTHLNKVFGEQMPLVDVSALDPASGQMARLHSLTPQQKTLMQCSYEDRCTEPATHFANVVGEEILCCERHAADLRRRNSQNDASSWFCRELKPDKSEDPDGIMWFIGWKIPDDLREDFGVLVWLWYPLPPDENSNKSTFTLFKDPDESIELPEGARWVQITKVEAAHLLGQLIYEAQRGRTPFIVGFAPDEPFDRPDPSLGYSVAKHVCSHCTSDMAEPYCFNFRKVASNQDMERTWSRNNLIIYTPEDGRIRGLLRPRRESFSNPEN